VHSLLTHGQIKTTLAKAKMIRPVVEKLITIAKKGNQDEQNKARYEANAISFFTNRQNKRIFEVVKKGEKPQERPRIVKRLFNEIAPTYETRNGGYTRIHKLGRRLGDNAEMALISLV
jgi:large subunit ribosomal protein L17